MTRVWNTQMHVLLKISNLDSSFGVKLVIAKVARNHYEVEEICTSEIHVSFTSFCKSKTREAHEVLELRGDARPVNITTTGAPLVRFATQCFPRAEGFERAVQRAKQIQMGSERVN